MLPDANEHLKRAKNRYGWYRWRFVLPKQFAGRPLFVELGRVVDLDWTYMNGRLIGSFTNGSLGWRTRRLYVAKPGVAVGGENVLAVKVRRLRSISGLLSRPSLGVALMARESRWEYAQAESPVRSTELPKTGHRQWRQVGQNQAIPADSVQGYVCFRTDFKLPEVLRRRSVALQVRAASGPYLVFLNGRLFTSAGRFPPALHPPPPVGSKIAPKPDALRFGEGNANQFLLVTHAQLAGKGVLSPASPVLWIDMPGAPLRSVPSCGFDPAAEIDLSRQLRKAGRIEEAWRITEKVVHDCGGHSYHVAMALGERITLLANRGRLKGAFEAFTRLQRDYPEQAYIRDVVNAVAAFQKREFALNPDFVYLGRDDLTRGNWTENYGSYACVLGGMMQYDLVNGPGWPVPYSFRCADPTQSAKVYIGALVTKDPRALISPFKRTRTMAWRDDYGEHHNFQLRGPDLLLDLRLPDGVWRLSFYIVDPDWSKTEHPRDLSIVILDRTGTPVAVARAASLAGGAYFRFLCRGGQKLTARICKHLSPDANLSGVFLDRVQPLIPLPSWLGAKQGAHAKPQDALRLYDKLQTPFGPKRGSLVSWVRGLRRLRSLLIAAGKRNARASAGKGAVDWMMWQAAEGLGDWSRSETASRRIVQAQVQAGEPGMWPSRLAGLLKHPTVSGSGVMRLQVLRALAGCKDPRVSRPALLRLARLHCALLRDDDAVSTYRKLLAAKPAPDVAAQAHYALATIYHQRGAASDAIAHFQLAQKAAPKSDEAVLARQFVTFLEREKKDRGASAKAK